MTETTPRPDGHVNHGGPILDRHDYRDWVEWDLERGPIPPGARTRWEYITLDHTAPVDSNGRFYVHPDDVPTDPDAELVERVAGALAHDLGFRSTYDLHRTVGRGVIEIVRAHDKADR
jgi:hypothetical protein